MPVIVSLGNGNTATAIANADGIACIALTGVSENTVVQGTPFLVTTMADVNNTTVAGLTVANNAFAFNKLQNLFNELTILGITAAKLYVMLMAPTVRASQICDNTNANGMVKLLNFAGGTARLCAVCVDDVAAEAASVTITVTNGINADIYTAESNAQALAIARFNVEQPLRIIIGATSFTGTASALTDLTTHTNNRVAILLGDVAGHATRSSSMIGIVLGRLMAIPVQRKISKVKLGAISSVTAYIANTSADQYSQASVIAGKGFITVQTVIGKSGFFFTGDPTCTATTDDYASVARGRVIDKAHVLAYATMVSEIDGEVPVNTDGTIDAGFAKYLEQQMRNVLDLNMLGNKNISLASNAFVDPAQIVNTTNKVQVVVSVKPYAYASEIDITLGYQKN
ncbi:MAG: hypothetical protein H0X33_14475 [Taibaiella sp.]|nr:hypothetical protein [Taibaiella sp.]